MFVYSLCPFFDFFETQGTSRTKAASENLQVADFPSELAVKPGAAHGLVEIPDHQRANIRAD